MYRHIPLSEQLWYELGYKITVVKQYILNSSLIPFSDLLQEVLFRTRVSQGKSRIVSVKSEGDYWKVKFAGFQPLFYPKDLPLYDLYIVAGENYNPTNWHYYNVPDTRVTKNDVVVDCGAAAGTFTLSALKASHRTIA